MLESESTQRSVQRKTKNSKNNVMQPTTCYSCTAAPKVSSKSSKSKSQPSISKKYLLSLTIILALFQTTSAVDRSNFKKCDQSSFCKRQRNYGKNPSKTLYSINKDSVSVDNKQGLIQATIINTKRNKNFPLTIQYFDRDTIRVKIDEESNLHSRYELESSIVGERKTKGLESNEISNSEDKGDFLKVKMGGDISLEMSFNPIKISLFEKDIEYFSLNGNSLFNIEHFREKPASQRFVYKLA